MVRDKKKLNPLLKSNKKNEHLNIYQNDISKAKPKIPYNLDYIFHLASKASPQEYINNPIDIINSNLFGTFNLTKIALEKIVINLYILAVAKYTDHLQEKIKNFLKKALVL